MYQHYGSTLATGVSHLIVNLHKDKSRHILMLANTWSCILMKYKIKQLAAHMQLLYL